IQVADETGTRLTTLRKALVDTPGADPRLSDEARALQARLKDLQVLLTGDESLSRRNEPTPPSIADRGNQIVGGHWTPTSEPTQTHRKEYQVASEAFADALGKLRALVEVDLKGLEDRAEAAGAPWTPGRVPRWTPE